MRNGFYKINLRLNKERNKMFRRKIRCRIIEYTLYSGHFTSKSQKLDVIDEFIGGSVWLSKILKKN